MAFCEPLKQMSMRWPSTSSGTPTRLATASTHQQRAQFIGDFAKRVDAREHAGGGLAVADADELDLASLARPAHVLGIDGAAERRFDAMDCDARMREAMMAMRSENVPLTQTMASSPGSSGLTTEASMPPEPQAESGNVTRFSV